MSAAASTVLIRLQYLQCSYFDDYHVTAECALLTEPSE